MTEIYPFMREYEAAGLLSFVSINLFKEQFLSRRVYDLVHQERPVLTSTA